MPTKQRLTLKLSPEEIKRLKKLAIDSGKSLSDFIVDETSYFDFDLTDFITLRIDYARPVRAGGEIIRIDIKFIEKGTQKVLRPLWYELWVSQEYVEDSLRIDHSPTDKELADFGFQFIAKRYKEGENELPKEHGSFISKKTGICYVASRESLWEWYDKMEPKNEKPS